MINYEIVKDTGYKGEFYIKMLIIDRLCVFNFNFKKFKIDFIYGTSHLGHDKTKYGRKETTIYKNRTNLGINVNSESYD